MQTAACRGQQASPPPGLRYEPPDAPPTLDWAAAITAVRERWQPDATSYQAYQVLLTNTMGGTLDTAGHLHPRWRRVHAWVVVCYGRFPAVSGPFRPAGRPPAGDYDHVYHALDAHTGEHLMSYTP
jgi:hypothetical protein